MYTQWIFLHTKMALFLHDRIHEKGLYSFHVINFILFLTELTSYLRNYTGVRSNEKSLMHAGGEGGIWSTLHHPFSRRTTLNRCRFNVGQRRRRWPNIKPALVQLLAFAGLQCPVEWSVITRGRGSNDQMVGSVIQALFNLETIR